MSYMGKFYLNKATSIHKYVKESYNMTQFSDIALSLAV